jgi:hypothetical protein
MPPTRNNNRSKLLALALLACAAPLRAEESAVSALSYEIEGGASYVGTAEFKRGDAREGGVSQFDTRAHFVLSRQLRDDLLLRVGVDWQRYSFDLPARATLPHSMQSLGLVIGADLTLGQAWLVRVEAQPGFAGTGDELGWDSARIPFVIGASLIVSSDLQFVVGVSIDANRKYPVLPGVGVRWKFAERWVLNGILPAPRLEYSPTKNLLLYAGGEVREDTYHVNEPLGASHGTRPLDGTVVDSWEVRAGAGLAWKPQPGWTVELEGGCVPFHEFDFYRAEERVRSVETPGYVRLGVKASF